MNLVALQIKTSKNFEKNLSRLLKHIKKQEDSSFIVLPELCLTGYSYDRLDEAVAFGERSLKTLKFYSNEKTLAITMLTSSKGKYYNTLHIIHNGKVIHTQSKHKLFQLGNEDKHFEPGALKQIKSFNINGIKVGCLICFELRFTTLWERLQGCDIIIIPAMWGRLRKENFETLTKALAIINQCYVIASNSSNDDMAKSSSVISPFGVVIKNDTKKVISSLYDPLEVKKMRKYLPIGLQ